MKRGLIYGIVLLLLAACGIQRPLIAPKDIPAYEAKREKKRAKLEQEVEKANPPPPSASAAPTTYLPTITPRTVTH